MSRTITSRLTSAILLTLTVAACSDAPVAAVRPPSTPNLLSVPIPSGFQLMSSGTGVAVYRKNYSGGQPDYVTVADMRYATVMNLTGTVQGSTVSWKSVPNFWNDAVARNTTNRRAKVVVNGTFFDPNNNPTGIAFGLKVSGRVISEGYDKNYPNQTYLLPFDSWNAASSIQPWGSWIFYTGSPDVIGGLHPTVNKDGKGNSYIPRTYIGVRDDDGNGTAETILIFASAVAREVDAYNVLRNFGASGVMMLDGGGSTALVIDGTSYISGRSVPHAIAIFTGR